VKRLVLVLGTAAVLAADVAPAPAIDFGLGLFKRKSKSETPDRARQLVVTLQSDPDERNRRRAAEELRTLDPRTNPDLVPALIGSLQRDPSPAVRSEAVTTIGRLKPVNAAAGIAMETALQTDPDAKVREAIKGALWQYHVNGYRTPQGASALASQTSEPPLAAGRPAAQPPQSTARPRTTPAAPDNQFRPFTNAVGKGIFYQPTVEPPLAKQRPPEVSRPQPEVPPPSVPGTVLPPPMPVGSVPDPVKTTPAPAPKSGVPTVTPPPAPAGLPTIPVPPEKKDF
jgi:hypothetical protein